MKNGEWEFSFKMKMSFMVRCLEKPLGIATPKHYEKWDPIVYHTVYETDKTSYQTEVDENEKKGRELFWVYYQEIVWNNELYGYWEIRHC